MARRCAVLIDAENVAADVADPLFARVATWGDVCVRRMFGKFEGGYADWKAAADRNSVDAVYIPPLTAGKNSADIALVIDAMDLLHRGQVEGFCLVTSDSDFTRLAWRLRAEGRTVRGVGCGKKTLAAFREACSEFIEVEILTAALATPDVVVRCASPKMIVRPSAGSLSAKTAIPLIERAIESLPVEVEWHAFNKLGNAINMLDPTFRVSNYSDCESLKDLAIFGGFRVRIGPNGHSQIARRL